MEECVDPSALIRHGDEISRLHNLLTPAVRLDDPMWPANLRARPLSGQCSGGGPCVWTSTGATARTERVEHFCRCSGAGDDQETPSDDTIKLAVLSLEDAERLACHGFFADALDTVKAAAERLPHSSLLMWKVALFLGAVHGTVASDRVAAFLARVKLLEAGNKHLHALAKALLMALSDRTLPRRGDPLGIDAAPMTEGDLTALLAILDRAGKSAGSCT